jgi:hypothetical protein
MSIELVQVQMLLSNPLNISLCIENLSLTYAFDEGKILVEPQVLDELLLAPSSTTQVIYIYIHINNVNQLNLMFFISVPIGYSWFEN